MSHDFDAPASSRETDLLRLELGDDVRQFVDTVEQNGFDRDEATYTFTDPDFLARTWLPIDLASLVATNNTAMKRIDVSYSNEPGQARPGTAVVLYLENGERITLTKQAGDPAKSDFGFDYTDAEDTLEPITRSDVMRLITSLLSPDMSQERATMSYILAEKKDENDLDPTHPYLALLITQLLPQRADTWKREESVELPIEDDRDSLKVVKMTGTEQSVAKVSFIQEGSEISPESYFEATATQDIDSPEAYVSFERAWSMDQAPEFGDAEQQVHVYDFMRTVVRLAEKAIGTSSPLSSYEMEAARILRKEAREEKADEEDLG